MEKKKLLYVTASVGLFLVIVIGAGYLAFSSGNKTSQTVESRTVPLRENPFYPNADSPLNGDLAEAGTLSASPDAADPVRNSIGFSGLDNTYYTNDQISPDGSRMVLRVPQPGSAISNAAPAQSSPAAPKAVSVAPTAPKTSTQAPAPAAPKTSTQAPAPAAPKTSTQTPAPAAPKTSTQAPAPAAPKTSTQTPTPAAPKTAPAALPANPAPGTTYDTWWIQTNSFTAQSRAEAVKETLSSKGIGAIIETRDIEGRAFFRVRVGPYTSHNEAAYWLNLVKAMEGFEESQIWQNKSRL